MLNVLSPTFIREHAKPRCECPTTTRSVQLEKKSGEARAGVWEAIEAVESFCRLRSGTQHVHITPFHPCLVVIITG